MRIENQSERPEKVLAGLPEITDPGYLSEQILVMMPVSFNSMKLLRLFRQSMYSARA